MIKAMAFLFCLGFTLIARSNACQSVLRQNDVHYKHRIEFVGKPVFPIERYIQELTNMDSLIHPLKSPSGTRYQLIANGGIGVNHFNDRINEVKFTDRTPKYANKKYSHPSHELAFLYHENGHAIFEQNLREQNLDYQSVVSFANGGRDILLKQLGQEKETLNLQLKSTNPNDLETINQLNSQISKLSEEWSRVYNSTAKLFWRSALHEAFADIMAVTVTKDPRSVSKVFMVNSKDEIIMPNNFSSMTREFLMPTPNNLRKWKAGLEKSIFPDPYFWLLPVRWSFWQTVNTRINSPNYQKQIMPIIFKILSEEFSRGCVYFDTEKIHNANYIPKDFFIHATNRINQRIQQELQ